MTIPPISALPTPPSRSSASGVFPDQADAFLGAFPTLQAEMNAAIDAMNEGSYNDGLDARYRSHKQNLLAGGSAQLGLLGTTGAGWTAANYAPGLGQYYTRVFTGLTLSGDQFFNTRLLYFPQAGLPVTVSWKGTAEGLVSGTVQMVALCYSDQGITPVPGASFGYVPLDTRQSADGRGEISFTVPATTQYVAVVVFTQNAVGNGTYAELQLADIKWEVGSGRTQYSDEATTRYALDNRLNKAGDAMTGPLQLASYTVGTVPSAAANPRGQIYVSNETGGATPAFSDGTNWRRYADRTIIS